MASRSVLRLATPHRLPLHLYRIAIPYHSTLTLQRQNFSTTTIRPTPPSQNLDLNNPLYRDLIKSIKNPFVGDLIHKLVQGNITFTECLSQDLHGAGNSLYFRIPELPPKMKGHDQDPDGIPLPPNTFRVGSVEELRSILSRILMQRAGSETDISEKCDESTGRDNANVGAAAESVKKEDIPSAEPKTPPPPPPPPPPPKSNAPEELVWNPSESLDAFKARVEQYIKSGRKLVGEKVQGRSFSSVLEPLEQQVQQIRESLRKGEVIASYNGFLEKRVKGKMRELGKLRQLKKNQWEESIDGKIEKEAKEREAAQESVKEKLAMHQESPATLNDSISKRSTGSAATDSRSDTLEKNQNSTDSIEPVAERITLMDILNGTASSNPQKVEEKTDSTPTSVDAVPRKSRSWGTIVDDPDSPPMASASPAPHTEFLISKLSRELYEARNRISELEASSANVPDFQKFTDHMDEALATQYSDLRDYFEERVLSESRDVAARVGSLENMMQKILENQEAAAAAAAAQSKDGTCIYSTECSEPGEEPKVPVTVKLDDIDKAAIQEVVDTAVNTAVEKVLAGIDQNRKENNEDLVEAIVDAFEDFKSYYLVEKVMHDVLDSEAMSKHLNSFVTTLVRQVLEDLGKDENGDLQRIVDAAVKAGTRDMEETVRSKLGNIQFKLAGMERIVRGM
ncbi:hypothetical protein TWF281_009343 [Arthrobotrys megalospora]